MNETKAKDAVDEDEDGAEINGEALEHIDEAELGDDPFARAEAPADVDSGNEPWLKTDRDYTYKEVCCWFLLCVTLNYSTMFTMHVHSSSTDSTVPFMPRIPPFSLPPVNGTPLRPPKFLARATRSLYSLTSPISASGCIGSRSMSSSSCSLRWVRLDQWTARGDLSSRADSSKSRWRTF